MSNRFPLRQHGITLVEMIVFMVVVGIALAGILSVMNLSSRASVDPLRRKQALIIAEGLLEEVELAKFSYCDPADPDAEGAASLADCKLAPEGWGQRAPEPVGAGYQRPYDNVNDYVDTPGAWRNAFDDAGGQLVDANGNPLDVSGYKARLKIAPAVLNGVGAGGSAADTELLRITVEVSYGEGSVVLDGYRARYAPNHL